MTVSHAAAGQPSRHGVREDPGLVRTLLRTRKAPAKDQTHRVSTSAGPRRAGEARVLVRLLGPLDLLTPQGAITLPSRLQQTLLAVLALAPGRVVATDALIDAVWSREPPPTARPALRVHLARLRGVLRGATGSDLIRYRAPGYLLDGGPVDVDAAAFERLTAQGDALTRSGEGATALGLREQALALWRGPAFEGLHDVEVLAQEAFRLEDLRARVEEELLETRLTLGQHRQVVAEAVRLVEQMPLRERRTAQLMVALYRTGRQADALRAAARLRERLADELGLDPGPEVQRLELAVLRHEEDLSWAAHPTVAGGVRTPRTASARQPAPRTGTAQQPAVRALVAERTSGLPPENLLLLRLVAILGGTTIVPVLAAAYGHDEAETARTLSETHRRSGLLAPLDGAVVELQHGALTTALLEPLPEDVVRSLHHRAARAIELVLGEAGLPAAAEHLLSAVPDIPVAEACHLVGRAVDVALRRHEEQDATALCRRALRELDDRQGPPAPRIDLLVRLATAQARLGALDDAEAVWADAVRSARALEDPERFALAVLAHDWTRRAISIESPDRALLAEALEQLGPRRTALRLRVASALLGERTVPGRALPEGALAEEIRGGLSEEEDALAAVAALHAEHVVLRPSPEAARRRGIGGRLLTAAQVLGDAYWLAVADLATLYDLLAEADGPEVARRLAELRMHADSAASARIDWHLAITEATLHRLAGRWAEADMRADAAAVSGAAAGVPDALGAALVHRFLVDFHTGSVAPYAPVLLHQVSSRPANTLAHAAAAVALAEAGAAPEAASAVEAVLDVLQGTPRDESFALCLGLITEAIVRLPDGGAHVSVVRRLLAPYGGQIVVFGQIAAAFGPADRSLALLAAADDDLPEAFDRADSAVTTARRLGSETWEVRCEVDRLRLQLAGGRRPASRLLGKLRSVATTRTLQPCVRDIDALMRLE